MSAKKSYDDVLQLMREHHKWFNTSIPLIASENIPSPAVREALVGDFGNRYAEGWPGERVYAGCIYIDQVELICNDLARNGRTPNIGMVGGSAFLFPHPVKELAEFMHAYGRCVNYDGGPVAGLI